jgi:succinate dehydrogenase / fumarate reductase cytochrome b subunit
MIKKNLPLSPHIGIYKPQITSVLSILHRITGVSLFLGLIGLLWCFVIFVYYGSTSSNPLLMLLSSCIGKILFSVWSYSLFFHLCTGIRHILWDAGVGFEVKAVSMTGWVAIVASIALTAISWIAAMQIKIM